MGFGKSKKEPVAAPEPDVEAGFGTGLLMQFAADPTDRRCDVPTDVVGEEYPLAFYFTAIKIAQGERPVRMMKRREEARRICEAAAAVQQSGDRVREQRSAGRRPCDQLDALQDIVRDDVEEILREAPDRRWLSKQLVRVEIRLAVIAIAVIEMAVDHQDA